MAASRLGWIPGGAGAPPSDIPNMEGIEAGCGPEEITAPGYAGVGSCVGVGGIDKGGTGAVAGVMEGPIVGPIAEVSTLHGEK